MSVKNIPSVLPDCTLDSKKIVAGHKRKMDDEEDSPKDTQICFKKPKTSSEDETGNRRRDTKKLNIIFKFCSICGEKTNLLSPICKSCTENDIRIKDYQLEMHYIEKKLLKPPISVHKRFSAQAIHCLRIGMKGIARVSGKNSVFHQTVLQRYPGFMD